MAQGIMALAPRKMAEGGKAEKPQNLQEKIRVRRLLEQIAMDGSAPDKGPDGKPVVRKVNGEWVVMVGGKPVSSMARGGPVGRMQGGGGSQTQDQLRGRHVVPPPPGFVPGFNPEMMYFQNDPENPQYPAYSAPWNNNLYAGSPINRFNPRGGSYFQSIIPGAQQPPMRRGGGGGRGNGIAGVIPATAGWPAVAGGGSGPSVGRGGLAPIIAGGGAGGGGGSGGGARPGGGSGGGANARDAGYAPGLGQMGQAPSRGFNDTLNRMFPDSQQGTQVSPGMEWAMDNAGMIGMGLGMATGIPGLGYLARNMRNNWYMNDALQNPADFSNAPLTPNEQISQSIDGLSSPVGGEGRDGSQGPGGRSPSMISSFGAWRKDAAGDWRFRPRGFGKASGGMVTLDGPFGPVQMAAGGITEMGPQQQAGQPTPEDMQMVAAAITGEAGDQSDAIINMFIEKYGTDVFRMVREMVLQQAAPNAQTEGIIEGEGGGMDDQVPGVIGDQQPVAVSPGEYIVPADVVSGLGDGSSDAGAKELDQMSQNVRMARGGTAQQPPPFDARKVMPA